MTFNKSTTQHTTHKIINIKDTFEIDYVDCEQYDANGNAMEVHVPYKIITLKELQFNFSGHVISV